MSEREKYLKRAITGLTVAWVLMLASWISNWAFHQNALAWAFVVSSYVILVPVFFWIVKIRRAR